MKKILLLSLCISAYLNDGFAQNCKVLVESLAGTYEGQCKSDKANGKGTATGLDSYEGEFKAGYPEGTGKYIWKNKDWFEGVWKKGLREGKGTMHITDGGTKDSVINGYWKKDKYFGLFETAYKVLSQSQTISTVDITDMPGSALDEINIILSSVSGGTNTLSSQMKSGTALPKIKLSVVDVTRGSYLSFSEIPYQPKATKFILRKVEFPFTAHFRTENEFVEIAFNNAGNYTVDIKVLQ